MDTNRVKPIRLPETPGDLALSWGFYVRRYAQSEVICATPMKQFLSEKSILLLHPHSIGCVRSNQNLTLALDVILDISIISWIKICVSFFHTLLGHIWNAS